MSKKKFILNDETKKNQYGFRVRNSGLKLERFRNNPVTLDSHKGGNSAVIGRWEDIQIEGSLLTAVAVFDMDDPEAAKIAGKVERGFIKGASLGLDPFTMSNFVLAPDDTYDLIECEVLEASVVAIPNNANALTVQLYATSEESIRKLVENEVSEILLMASDATKFNQNKQMKITLTLSAVSALGLPGNTLEHDSVQVESKIIELKSSLDTANKKIKDLEELEKDKKAKLSATTVDNDIKDGKIDATQREQYIKLHADMPDLYKTMVTDKPAKNNLSGTVAAVNTSEIKTLDDFQKLDLNAQLDFKNNNPEGYKALFKQ